MSKFSAFIWKSGLKCWRGRHLQLHLQSVILTHIQLPVAACPDIDLSDSGCCSYWTGHLTVVSLRHVCSRWFSIVSKSCCITTGKSEGSVCTVSCVCGCVFLSGMATLVGAFFGGKYHCCEDTLSLWDFEQVPFKWKSPDQAGGIILYRR